MPTHGGEQPGDRNPIPVEIAMRIRSGENPIRLLREWRGLRRDELATLSGVPTSRIEDLEAGMRDQKLLRFSAQIADALGVTVADLIR